MAANKKSFIAYSDWQETFNALPDEQAGKLIKHIFRYVNDEHPETEDYVINALFQQFKATLKRDLEKWERQKKQRVEAGKRSAELRNTKSNDRSTTVNDRQRNSTVSVSDSVNVSVKEREENFAKQVRSLNFELPETEIQKFINHWTEINPRGRKLKFEKEKTFDLKKRLAKWKLNYQDWNKKPTKPGKPRYSNDDYSPECWKRLTGAAKKIYELYCGDVKKVNEAKELKQKIWAALTTTEPHPEATKAVYVKINKYYEAKRHSTEKLKGIDNFLNEL